MATVKKKRVRFTFDVYLPSEEVKTAFLVKLDAVRKLLSPAGTPRLDNYGLLSALLELAERQSSSTADGSVHTRTQSALSAEQGSGSGGSVAPGPKNTSFLQSAGTAYNSTIVH